MSLQRDKLRTDIRWRMCAIRDKERYGKLDSSKDIGEVDTSFIILKYGGDKKEVVKEADFKEITTKRD